MGMTIGSGNDYRVQESIIFELKFTKNLKIICPTHSNCSHICPYDCGCNLLIFWNDYRSSCLRMDKNQMITFLTNKLTSKFLKYSYLYFPGCRIYFWHKLFPKGNLEGIKLNDLFTLNQNLIFG